MNEVRIGVDLGGTKIEIVALDRDGRELVRRRIPSPAHDYDAVLARIATLVADVESELDVSATVGIGTPGAVTPSGVMQNANSVVLIGRPLRDDLSRALRRDVRIANDANCLALSEASDGAAAGARCVVGVILGTGVGSGIVVDGNLVVGCNAIAGEWGHNPLPWPTDDERPGPPCYCGKTGCIETFLSGPGFARDDARATGAKRDVPAIVRAAADGDAGARASLDRYVDRLARSLAAVANVLDPDVFVLGGGVSNAPLYGDVVAKLPAYVCSRHVATRVVAAAFGDASGVRGAAWLWP